MNGLNSIDDDKHHELFITKTTFIPDYLVGELLVYVQKFALKTKRVIYTVMIVQLPDRLYWWFFYY